MSPVGALQGNETLTLPHRSQQIARGPGRRTLCDLLIDKEGFAKAENPF